VDAMSIPYRESKLVVRTLTELPESALWSQKTRSDVLWMV
jgi:hypothetical protein